MQYVDEFRDPRQAEVFLREIRRLRPQIGMAQDRPLWIMEVCGGHTHTIFRYGINRLLPETIEFVHGPGCPVCVLPRGRVDDCIALAERDGVIMTTFGDAMRVTGSTKSLLQAKAEGADIRTVYSPLDALALAKLHPDREVVFFGLGFETTMPSTALTLLQAQRDGVRNFSLFCNHITIMPTIETVLDSPNLHLDALIGPGHVSLIIGLEPYAPVAERYRKPVVVAGFEPLDLLQAVVMILRQLAEGRRAVENQYLRVVSREGNRQALEVIDQVFEPREFFEWRGLGSIDRSGVRIKDEFAAYDAERKFSVPNLRIMDPDACQCGDVLRGLIKPPDCRVFGTRCTPQNPLGALMVSSEGACAAYYRYGRTPQEASQAGHTAR